MRPTAEAGAQPVDAEHSEVGGQSVHVPVQVGESSGRGGVGSVGDCTSLHLGPPVLQSPHTSSVYHHRILGGRLSLSESF